MNEDQNRKSEFAKMKADLEQANLRMTLLEKKVESQERDFIATIKELEKRMMSMNS